MSKTLDAALWFHALRGIGHDPGALEGLVAVSRAQRLQLKIGGIALTGDAFLLHMLEGEPEAIDRLLETTSGAAWRGPPLIVDRRPILTREFRWWSPLDGWLTPGETAWLSGVLARPPYDVEAIESLARWAGYRAAEIKLGVASDATMEAPWISRPGLAR